MMEVSTTHLVVLGCAGLWAFSSVALYVALLFDRGPRRKPARTIEELHLAGRWHAERQEALAEEAIGVLGWSHDPYSIQAEIAREIIYEGRRPADAEQRISEVATTPNNEAL